MTTVSIVLAVALFLLVHACMKWGAMTAIKWASAVALEFPVFWFSGWLTGIFLEKAGVKAPPMRTWLVIGSVVALVVWQIAKRAGWPKVLGALFMVALCFSAIVVMLFLFLMMGVAVHATPQAMVFIAIGSIIFAGISRGDQARGR